MTNKQNRFCAIIVAAGKGSRAGGGALPKQFWPLGAQGSSVLDQAALPFLQSEMIERIVIVTDADNLDKAQSLNTAKDVRVTVVLGGATRQASVLAGLKALETANPDYVLIHDGARPLVQSDKLKKLMAAAAPKTGFTLALPVTDTLTRIENGQIEALSRENVYAVQTPQLFPYPTLFKAHQHFAQAGQTDFTDDTSLMAATGMPIETIMGASENIKITFPDDLKRAEQILSMRQEQTNSSQPTNAIPDIRVGHGYDLHTLVAGDGVILCGVKIPHDKKLSGHSDADVALHALTDALLASIADGDIGSHFPPSDPQWLGAKSDQFLIHAHNLVKQKGGHLTHCDITIVCEEPKIGPHRDNLRKNLASILEIDVSRVSVKATTNEQIGSIGRKEGICALATATVVFV